MSKNISFRLLAVVMAVVLVVIAALSIYSASMIKKYSIDVNTKIKAELAEAVVENISVSCIFAGQFEFGDEFTPYAKQLEPGIKRMAERCGGEIYFIKADGTVVISSEEGRTGTAMMDPSQFNLLAQSSKSSDRSTMYGSFSSVRSNYFLHVMIDNDVKGVVIVSTPDSGDASFTEKAFASVLAVSLWLLLIAFVLTCYIIFRYTNPLKEISRVVKECEKGNFDERIKITGNNELSELSRSVNNMLETLSVNDKQRRNFMASVSHDLRTPMTTISGFVDGILDGTIPPEKKDDYLEIISGEAKRLTRLVNTLLSVASTNLSSAKPVLVSFNLSEKARQILISFEKKIEQKRIDVEFIGDEDVFVSAEPDSIHQVIYNLCDNAVKFTNEGGKLTLAIEEKNGKASVRIRNTGDGISTEELPHIFESFYKTDASRGKDKHGVGLGLYIVKTVLNNHGEAINCKSVPGEYTEFSFNLKLADEKKERS